MISLDEYKKILIDYYRYECDNDLEKLELRKKELAKKYSDEYLNKIIEDTYNVIKIIFEKQPNSFIIEMDDDTTTYVNLNLIGGYFSDRLYVDPYGKIISESILKNIFGPQLIVDVMDEEIQLEDEDSDIVSFDYKYSLYLQGFPENMEDIKKELFEKNKVKMR